MSVLGALRAPVDASPRVLRAAVYTPVARDVHLSVFPEGGTPDLGPKTAVPAGKWTVLTRTVTPTPGVRYQPQVYAPRQFPEPLWVDAVTDSRTAYTPGEYFDGDTVPPTPEVVRDVWVATDGTPHTFDPDAWVWAPHTEHKALGDQVIATAEAHAFTAAHTLIVLVRPDEVPQADVPAFQTFLNTSGAAPAGHQILAVPAAPTWAQWQAHVGDTWATMHARAPRWVDHHSAGITLGDEQ